MRSFKLYTQAVYLNNVELTALPMHSQASTYKSKMTSSEYLATPGKNGARSLLFQQLRNKRIKLVEARDKKQEIHPETLNSLLATGFTGLAIYKKSFKHSMTREKYQISQKIPNSTIVWTSQSNLANFSSLGQVFEKAQWDLGFSTLNQAGINAMSTDALSTWSTGQEAHLAALVIDQIDLDGFTISVEDDESSKFGVYVDIAGVEHSMMSIVLKSVTKVFRIITPRIFVKECRAEQAIRDSQPELFKRGVYLYGPDFSSDQVSNGKAERNTNYDHDNAITKEEPENRLKWTKKQLQTHRSKAVRNNNLIRYETTAGSRIFDG
jgi:hypothetical protein